jgi:transposase
MLSWLRATQPLADEALRRSAVFASHGIPGSALALMQGDAAAIESHLRAIATSGDTDNRQRERLAASVATAAAATRFETLVAIAPTLAASLAREAAPARRAAHLDAFGSIERLCRNAVQGSYEKSMVAFEIGSIFAQMNGEGAHSAFP